MAAEVSSRLDRPLRAVGLLAGACRQTLVALLALCCTTFAVPPAGAEDAFHIGVNRVNLAWASPDEQEEILGQIAASGVTDVRLSLSRPVDRSIEALAIADRLGLRILLEIQLTNKSYYPANALPRTGHDRIWDIRRLSELDVDLYRRELRGSFQRIDELGIRLTAVEPGNEINISPYNGDLLVYPEPGASTARSVGELENRTAFERGLDNYIAALKVTREELSRTANSRDAALVSAGLSDMGADFADKKGFERVDAAKTIEMLQERGLDDLVDAYGIHLYVGDRPADLLEARITDVLDFCRSGDTGKPCWLTEWGIANQEQSCPVDDREREATIRIVRETFDEMADAERLDAIFYYDWDTHDRYSLWRCGVLSPAGEMALGVGQGTNNAEHLEGEVR